MPQISVDQLFSDNQAKLSFEWAAGKGGGSRIITGDAAPKPTVGLVGHMNFIHPFRVQVLGPAEFNHLKAQTPDGFAAVIDRLFTSDLAVVIVANNEPVPAHLALQADRFNTAVFTSAQPSAHIVEVLRIYLARVLAESTTLHGVFLDVLEIGVLITGASAIGKSELALELISRGHGLIADDIVEFHRTSPDTLEGRCPPILRDFLEVRGIGIINIKTIFGETAVRDGPVRRFLCRQDAADHRAPRRPQQ